MERTLSISCGAGCSGAAPMFADSLPTTQTRVGWATDFAKQLPCTRCAAMSDHEDFAP